MKRRQYSVLATLNDHSPLGLTFDEAREYVRERIKGTPSLSIEVDEILDVTHPLPETRTSSEFGELYMVRIDYNTDDDGREVDPNDLPLPCTFHGPFVGVAEASEWADARVNGDTNVVDALVIALNKVRP